MTTTVADPSELTCNTLDAIPPFRGEQLRYCTICARPMTGRSDRETCSSSCRQKAYRRRRPPVRHWTSRWCFGSCGPPGKLASPHPIGDTLLIVHIADRLKKRPLRSTEKERLVRRRTAAEIYQGWHDQEPPPDFVATPGWPDVPDEATMAAVAPEVVDMATSTGGGAY